MTNYELIEDFGMFETEIIFNYNFHSDDISEIEDAIKNIYSEDCITEKKKKYGEDFVSGIIKEYYRRYISYLRPKFYNTEDLIRFLEYKEPGIDKRLQRLFKTENYVKEIAPGYAEEERKTLHFTLDVVPHSKKNSSQICRLKNGRTLLLPSKLYKKFENDCLSLIQVQENLQLNLSNPITVKAHFYCKTRRKIDLTNLLEALDDMLVKAGVIKDDCRDVIASHDGSRVFYDKEKPRIEIWIEDFKEDYIIWKKDK